MASASTPADTSVSSGIPSTSTEADPAQTQMPSTQTATPEVEVLSGEQKATDAGAIQLVPKKPSLWTRIKFLFTGRLLLQKRLVIAQRFNFEPYNQEKLFFSTPATQ